MSIIDHVCRVAARLRRVLAPRPWARWVVLVVAALVFLTAVADHRRDLEAARSAWGDGREVWISDGLVDTGSPIVATLVERPLAVLPDDAVDDDPNGTVARQTIGSGEIIVDHDVAGRDAPADLIPAGWLAVPVAESTASHARIGERVVVTTDGVVIGDEAVVVDDLEGIPLVAVPAEDAPLVALANDAGVTLLRTP